MMSTRVASAASRPLIRRQQTLDVELAAGVERHVHRLDGAVLAAADDHRGDAGVRVQALLLPLGRGERPAKVHQLVQVRQRGHGHHTAEGLADVRHHLRPGGVLRVERRHHALPVAVVALLLDLVLGDDRHVARGPGRQSHAGAVAGLEDAAGDGALSHGRRLLEEVAGTVIHGL